MQAPELYIVTYFTNSGTAKNAPIPMPMPVLNAALLWTKIIWQYYFWLQIWFRVVANMV